MANHRALTIQAGVTTRQQDADLLIVGAGITTSSGALTIQSASGAIQVVAGQVLATTGTGNINLPNNGSAKFQIEGVAVGATVIAVNLDTLTNGSNADALHVHSGMDAAQLVRSGLTTTGLAVGDFGYISAVNTLTKTDADVLVSSRTIGANEGTVGSMTVGGIVESAKFTTIGGSPANGAPVYLAPATEEASASGKLTATAPTATGKVVAEVGICTDNTNYAGAKTSQVLLQPKAVVQL